MQPVFGRSHHSHPAVGCTTYLDTHGILLLWRKLDQINMLASNRGINAIHNSGRLELLAFQNGPTKTTLGGRGQPRRDEGSHDRRRRLQPRPPTEARSLMAPTCRCVNSQMSTHAAPFPPYRRQAAAQQAYTVAATSSIRRREMSALPIGAVQISSRPPLRRSVQLGKNTPQYPDKPL